MKDKYPSTCKYARRGLANGCRVGAMPAEPTCAPPGSRAKMRVMQQRLLRGERLHHPGDCRLVDDGLTKPFEGFWKNGLPTGLETGEE